MRGFESVDFYSYVHNNAYSYIYAYSLVYVGNPALVDLTLSTSVVAIMDEAFSNCNSLATLSIPT